MIASDVTMPSCVSARKAAAMMMPSQKLWMLSPTDQLQPPRPACSRVEAVVVVVPVALVMVRVAVQLDLLQQEEEQQAGQQRGEQARAGSAWLSNASGSTCEQRGASSTPADRLTRCCTISRQHPTPSGWRRSAPTAGRRGSGDDDPDERHRAREASIEPRRAGAAAQAMRLSRTHATPCALNQARRASSRPPQPP